MPRRDDIVTPNTIARYFPDDSRHRRGEIRKRVIALIEEYLRSSFTVKEFTEVYDTRSNVVTYHLPIIEVVQIEDISVDPIEVLEDTNYVVYAEAINFPTRTPKSKDLRITYTAGMTEIPALVKVVAEDIVRFWAFKEGKTDELFFKSEDMEDRSYTNREINESTLLAQLAGLRYLPLDSYSKNRQVRIGVI